MTEYQITIFDALKSGHDSQDLSCPSVEYPACIETYHPGGRAAKYYRLCVNINGNKKRFHIRGGSTIAKLANYRKQVLQDMIDRGSPVKELIAQVIDWR